MALPLSVLDLPPVPTGSTGADALHRIGGSVAGTNKALQAVDTGTLFWTEPANLDTLFIQNEQVTGNPDE